MTKKWERTATKWEQEKMAKKKGTVKKARVKKPTKHQKTRKG